jgi:hypothetical protein
MQDMHYNASKVDLALAALSKLPVEERKTIMEGLKEIVSGYAQKSGSKVKTEKSLLGWWDW